MAKPDSSKEVRAGGNPRPPNAGKGRKKGVPNRSTREVREVIAEFAKAYAPNFEGWIDRVATTDPARAAELYLRSLEYHIPKLVRTHVTGPGSMTLADLVASIPPYTPEEIAAQVESYRYRPAPTPGSPPTLPLPTTYQRITPEAEPAPAHRPLPPLVDPIRPPAPTTLYDSTLAGDRRTPEQIERDEYERMQERRAELRGRGDNYDVFDTP